jgi:hypothetical protein
MLRTIQCQYETVHFAPSVLKGGSRLLSQNLAKLLATDASVQMRSVSLFVEIGSPVIIGECVPTEHACTGSFDGGRIQNPFLYDTGRRRRRVLGCPGSAGQNAKNRRTFG